MQKALAVLSALVTIALLWTLVGLHSVRTLASDPQFAKDLLATTGVYAELQTSIADQIYDEMPEPALLTRADVDDLARRLLPQERLAAKAGAAVDGFYAWMKSDAERPSMLIDLSDVRQALPGELTALFQAKVQALPACTLAETARLLVSYAGGMPPCKPVGGPLLDKMVEVGVARSHVQDAVPPQMDLAVALEEENGPEMWTDLRGQVDQVNGAFAMEPLGWAAAAVLAALLVLLNRKRWTAGLGWVSAVLLAGGAPWLWAPRALTAFAEAQESDPPLGTILQAATQRLGTEARVVAITLTGTGLVCLVVALIGRAKAKGT